MKQSIKNNERKLRRRRRVRAKISGTKDRPRLSVFRSAKHINCQLIDDTIGTTLVGVKDQELKDVKGSPVERAEALGELLAKKAIEKNIKTAVFDKGAYKYHGRVKAVGEGARKGGLKI